MAIISDTEAYFIVIMGFPDNISVFRIRTWPLKAHVDGDRPKILRGDPDPCCSASMST